MPEEVYHIDLFDDKPCSFRATPSPQVGVQVVYKRSSLPWILFIILFVASCTASKYTESSQSLHQVGQNVEAIKETLDDSTATIKDNAEEGVKKTPNSARTNLMPHWLTILGAVGQQEVAVKQLDGVKEQLEITEKKVVLLEKAYTSLDKKYTTLDGRWYVKLGRFITKFLWILTGMLGLGILLRIAGGVMVGPAGAVMSGVSTIIFGVLTGGISLIQAIADNAFFTWLKPKHDAKVNGG